MRFISKYCVKTGMVVDKTIYKNNGDLLLECGEKIKTEFISEISNIEELGIYINDEMFQNESLENLVKKEIKAEAEKGMKRVFKHMSIKTKDYEKDIPKIMCKIIENILDNQMLLLNMIDIKVFDDYTFRHSVNVAVLSLTLGVQLGLSDDELHELGIGALLHDIGKVFLSTKILNKKSKLEDSEFEIIKRHSKIGYDLLESNELISENSLNAIIDHHERCNGTGYPNKKTEEEISLYGKIIAICDVYDALTSKRVYRGALKPEEALKIIVDGSNIEFDSELVSIFCKMLETYN